MKSPLPTPLEQKVTSLALSRQLYEAGIVVESEFWWAVDEFETKLVDKDHINKHATTRKYYPAPLSSELGELLPVYAQFEKESLPFQIRIEKGIRDVDTDEWEVLYWRYSKTLVSEPEYQERGRVFADTEANARAKMLLFLKEKGLL